MRPLALVSLERAVLRRTSGVRIGRLFGVLVVLGFGAIAIILRVADGTNARFSGLVEQAVRLLALVASCAVAFVVAEDRDAAERAEGIDALVAMRGGDTDTLGQARAAAAMLQIALAIALPGLALTVLTVVLAGSARLAGRQAAMVVPVVIFALACGVTIGFVASLCSRVGGRRGRWLAALVIVGPWVALDLVGSAAWSIPGALDALLGFAIRIVGGSLGR